MAQVESAGMIEYPDGPGKTTKRTHPKGGKAGAAD